MFAGAAKNGFNTASTTMTTIMTAIIAVNKKFLVLKGNFTFTASGHKSTFYPLYMYNETMSGTVGNKPIIQCPGI